MSVIYLRMMTLSNGNIFRVTDPLCREVTDDKGQWRGALVFSLISTWTNGWVNNQDAGDLKRHHTHYVFIVMGGDGNRLISNYPTIHLSHITQYTMHHLVFCMVHCWIWLHCGICEIGVFSDALLQKGTCIFNFFENVEVWEWVRSYPTLYWDVITYPRCNQS